MKPHDLLTILLMMSLSDDELEKLKTLKTDEEIKAELMKYLKSLEGEEYSPASEPEVKKNLFTYWKALEKTIGTEYYVANTSWPTGIMVDDLGQLLYKDDSSLIVLGHFSPSDDALDECWHLTM